MGRGLPTPQVCKKLGVSEQTYYRWRKEYGGLRLDQAKRLKALEAVEFATLTWVDWFNTRRLLGPLGDILRIPDDREHRFQSNVNTDSGHVEQRFQDGEHGFRGT